MHEYFVTKEIFDIVENAAKENRANKVLAVHIELGALTTFDEESIRFYFEVFSRGSLSEGAEIAFIRVAGRAVCAFCGFEYELESYFDGACPRCGSLERSVSGGDCLRVVSIDVE